MMLRFLTALICAALLPGQRTAVDSAWELVAQGKRQEAVGILEKLIKANPSDGDVRLLLGSILAEEGKGAEAVRGLHP